MQASPHADTRLVHRATGLRRVVVVTLVHANPFMVCRDVSGTAHAGASQPFGLGNRAGVGPFVHVKVYVPRATLMGVTEAPNSCYARKLRGKRGQVGTRHHAAIRRDTRVTGQV